MVYAREGQYAESEKVFYVISCMEPLLTWDVTACVPKGLKIEGLGMLALLIC